VRTWIVAAGFCIILFFLPLQCFIIGDHQGVGIQGAVLRWQVAQQGVSLIPIPWEISYVTNGTYTGKTALMVILWALGTLVLTLITIISLVYWNQLPRKYLLFFIWGIITAGILYLASCITQYGPLFHGYAGVSMPFGVLILFIFAILLDRYQNFFYPEDDESPGNGKNS
jgi:hypothetical protein